MLKHIYQLVLPISIRETIHKVRKSVKNLYESIFPPVIELNKYVEKGCKFEITTRLEEYRVKSIGDERDFFEKFLSYVELGEILFDIGSCVGLFAIHAGALGCEVIAFEPDPGYLKRLRRNIRINRLNRKIKVVEWAVSDKKGFATLYSDGVEGNSPSLSLVGERGSTTVETNAIDNAIRDGKLPKPTLIKMDIEGAEVLALQGMKELLSSQNSPRLIFIEIHPQFLLNFGSSSNECMELIESFGFKQIQCVEREAQLHCIYEKVYGRS